jgi:c-di-GMP-related signal transduction protein
MSKFIVGRQPIFDAQLRVHGYELLFRDLASSRPSGETMTADVLVHAGLDMGLSALDLLLGVPLSEVVGGLSLTNELEEALLGGTGPLGGIVGDVQAWEVGDAEKLRPGLGELNLAEAYTEGLAWAIEVCGALETAS